ncbi:MAG: hypothetical protein FWG05_06270, partial [Kiritimatiellaeota bacterium]|nr:hypothetical protein [Kiritimatiellota bacterium]
MKKLQSVAFYVALSCALFAGAFACLGDTVWTGGSSDLWGDYGNWDNNLPAFGNGAIFEYAEPIRVFLKDDYSAEWIWLKSNNVNTVNGLRLLGDGADRTLTLRTGLGVDEGAGPLTIGSRKSGERVDLLISENSEFWNKSTNTAVIANSIGGNRNLTFSQSGAFRLENKNTFTGETHLRGSRLELDGDATLGDSHVRLYTYGGKLAVNDFPRTFRSTFLVDNGHGASFAFDGDAPLTFTGETYNNIAWIGSNAYNSQTWSVFGTAPVRLKGDFVTVNSGTGMQYQGNFNMGAAASLIFEGDVMNHLNQSPIDSGNGKGYNITFQSVNSDVRFIGDKRIISQSGAQNNIYVNNNGYNTISFYGDGG